MPGAAAADTPPQPLPPPTCCRACPHTALRVRACCLFLGESRPVCSGTERSTCSQTRSQAPLPCTPSADRPSPAGFCPVGQPSMEGRGEPGLGALRQPQGALPSERAQPWPDRSELSAALQPRLPSVKGKSALRARLFREKARATALPSSLSPAQPPTAAGQGLVKGRACCVSSHAGYQLWVVTGPLHFAREHRVRYMNVRSLHL